MTKEKLQKEISEINKELDKYKSVLKTINSLKVKKSALKKELDKITTKELPWEKKFEKWFYSSKGEHSRWIPDISKFPNLRELMKRWEWNRYETYDFNDSYPFSEVFGCIISPDGKQYAKEEGWDYKLIIKAAKEIMKNNLKSFKCDW